jgi:branched-chain amino acid transport system substrate-binding protein
MSRIPRRQAAAHRVLGGNMKRLHLAIAFAVVAASIAAIPATGSAAESSSQIVIGVPYAQTGTGAPTNVNMPNVIKAWTSYVNKQLKGIAGHQVKVVQGDTKTDPAAGLALVTQMVEQDKIIASVGGSDDTSVTATTTYFASKNIAVIGGVCYAVNVCGGPKSAVSPNGGMPNFFNVTTTIPAVVAEQMVAGKEVAKATKVGVLTCSESPSCASADPLYRSIVTSLGMEYVGLITFSQSDPSYTAPCLTMKQRGADYVQISGSGSAGAKIVADCATQGYQPTFGASAGTVSGPVWEPVSEANAKFVLTGGLNAFPWFADAKPVKTFRDAMAKYAKGKDYNDPTSTGTWASLELFRTAMEKYKSSLPANPTSADVFKAMYALQGEDLGGLLPQKMTYTQGQPAPSVNCFYLFKLAKEKWTTPDGALTPRCYP